MAIRISLDEVGVEWPTKRVLEAVSLGVFDGDRTGVVGPNGEGKTTLLRVLAGELEPDEGRVVARTGTRVGILGQADSLDDDTTVSQALFGDAPEYEWASSPKVREILGALLGDVGLERKIGELSGGERRRADLARLLVGQWDVLLLDEPTNHLDMAAIAWLAEHLVHRWPAGEGALVCVTHDRWFLDAVCTSMWELHRGRVEAFEGGFSAYLQQRLERDRLRERTRIRRANALRRELAWLSRGAKARSTKPKFRVREALALTEDVGPIRDGVALKRAAVARLGKQVLDLEGVSKAFGERTVLRDVTWSIGPGDRLGVLGANGAGKTTLLDLLCGVEEPSAGEIRRGASVVLARVSQHLDLLAGHEDEPLELFLSRFKRSIVVDGADTTSRALLESMGFAGKDFLARLGDLSGGQRRRLALVLALLQEPNVLVLDEPGNDLDVDTLAALEGLLDGWPGTLVIVTHDRYLMERVTDDVYALVDGRLRHVPGGVGEYLAQAAQGPRTQSPERVERKDSGEGALANAERQRLKRRYESLGRRIEAKGNQLAAARAAVGEVDPTDYEALTRAQGRAEALRAELEALEDELIDLALLLGEEP